MGQGLNYEIGKMNMNRMVKVFGRTPTPHGQAAKLVGAEPGWAVVLPPNHGQTEKVEWKFVRDWTSRNPQPLVMPKIEPELKPEPPIFKAVPIRPTATREQTPVIEAKPELPKDPFQVFITLGEKLKQGLADISAAEDLVDDTLEQYQRAQSEHAQAVAKVKELETQLDKVKNMVSFALTGTSGARA